MNTLDNPWGRRRKCFPSQQGLVSGCWTHNAKAQGNAVSIPAGSRLCRHIPWRSTGQHRRAGRHPRSLWRGSTGRVRRHDTEPYTTEDFDLLTLRVKPWKKLLSSDVLSEVLLLLLAVTATLVDRTSNKRTCRQQNTMPLKDEPAPELRRKMPNVTSETVE